MNDFLPHGWVIADFRDISEVIRGVTYTKEVASKQPRPDFLPILRATNIGSVLDFEDLVYVPQSLVSENQRLRPGDIVIAASSGSRSVVGKAAQLKSDWHGSFGAFCYGLRIREEVDPRFVNNFLQTKEYRNRVSSLAAGVNINNLRREHIESTPIPVPPLSEQRRIVAAIEMQFTRLDAAVAALERARANLKRYRAAVLAAACSGRLVPTEAELARAEGRNYESGLQFLARVLLARQARTIRRHREPIMPNSHGLPDLPEGWAWASADQLSVLITDGDHNPPKRVSHGIRHLTAKHIRNGRISFDGATFISDMDFEKTRTRLEPRAGDLIVTCVGTIGQTAIVPPSLVFSADRNLAAIRPVGIADEGRWIQIVLDSAEWQQRMGAVSGATAQPHLYLGDLRTLPIPLPPLAEQKRIITGVERTLSIIEVLNGTVTDALTRAGRLRQAILRRAFDGKLVPQDPTDEPASALLERIRAERAIAAPKSSKRARRRRQSDTGEGQVALL